MASREAAPPPGKEVKSLHPGRGARALAPLLEEFVERAASKAVNRAVVRDQVVALGGGHEKVYLGWRAWLLGESRVASLVIEVL